MAEEGATLRSVAERFGVTRQEICQYLTILRYLPDDFIVGVESTLFGQRVYSMRRLLAFARAARPACRPSGPYGIAETQIR